MTKIKPEQIIKFDVDYYYIICQAVRQFDVEAERDFIKGRNGTNSGYILLNWLVMITGHMEPLDVVVIDADSHSLVHVPTNYLDLIATAPPAQKRIICDDLQAAGKHELAAILEKQLADYEAYIAAH